VSEMTPEPPAATDAEELGLTPDQWMDLRYAYNSGRMDPEEGTVEDEAFRRLDADNHQDYLMRCERDRADAAYQKWAQAHPDEAAKRQAEIEAAWAEPVWECNDPRAWEAGAEADLEPEAEP
jgi:hypothetical protein